MKFLADENVDAPIVEQLRKKGYTVLYVSELAQGATDEQVLKLANQEHAILITADKGFGEMVFRQRKVTQGVILIRLSGTPPFQKAQIVASAISKHAAQMANAFTVITSKAVRIRLHRPSWR